MARFILFKPDGTVVEAPDDWSIFNNSEEGYYVRVANSSISPVSRYGWYRFNNNWKNIKSDEVPEVLKLADILIN